MKGGVAFLWEEYDNIQWQGNYEEQLSQAVSFRQYCQIFHFHKHSWACGARVRNSTAASGWVHWVPSWLAVVEVRSWNWKEKKDDFLQLWDWKRKIVWECRERFFERCPFPDCCSSETEFDLGTQVLTAFTIYLLLYLQLRIRLSADLQLLDRSVESLGVDWLVDWTFCTTGTLPRGFVWFRFVVVVGVLGVFWGRRSDRVCLGFFEVWFGFFFGNQSTCLMLANWIWELWRIRNWCRSYSGGHWNLRFVWMQGPTWFCWSQPRILTLTYRHNSALATLQAGNVGCIQKGKDVKRFWTNMRGDSEFSFASAPSTRECFSCTQEVLCVVWNRKWYSHMLHLLSGALHAALHNFWGFQLFNNGLLNTRVW